MKATKQTTQTVTGHLRQVKEDRCIALCKKAEMYVNQDHVFQSEITFAYPPQVNISRDFCSVTVLVSSRLLSRNWTFRGGVGGVFEM